jgi:hypothetical protein
MFLSSAAEQLRLNRRELGVFRKLSTPEKVESFVTSLQCNFERNGDTCHSVRTALKRGEAHCIEAAFVAALALMLHGRPALLMDMRAKGDDDHVVALFKEGPYWGAISKSNTVWLRWRDPIYRTLRELAMSYFHEYVKGPHKTLRSYSRPFDIGAVEPSLWVTKEGNCWEVASALDEIHHYPLISPRQAKKLRLRDRMERRIGRMAEYAFPAVSRSY